MDFALSEPQEMLKRLARDFLTEKCPKSLVRKMEEDEKGYSPQLWQEMAELGWMGLAFPEKYGGGEGSFLDLIVLLEEMGRACLPSPFLSTVILGAGPILDLGSEAQKQDFLPQVVQGKRILTLALTEPSARYDAAGIQVQAIPDKDSYIISGTKLFVPDAHIADYLVYATRTKEGVTLFLMDAKSNGIAYIPLQTIGGDKQFEVTFTGMRVARENMLGELGGGWTTIEQTLEKAALAKCAELVGGAQQVLEMTVSYTKQRVQFERPVGSFQAVQHHCADMVINLDGAKFLTYEAAWRLSEGLPYRKEISMAKSWTNEACRQVNFYGHTVIGGVGVIIDHDMPLYSRRAKAGELLFGDATFHREIVAQEMGL